MRNIQVLTELGCYYCFIDQLVVGMPQSSSEPKFEPELFRTGPKFGPRFDGCAELDHKSGSGFRQGVTLLNLVRTKPFSVVVTSENSEKKVTSDRTEVCGPLLHVSYNNTDVDAPSMVM
jgi:hypothetical protein